jgi:hypothetical protein
MTQISIVKNVREVAYNIRKCMLESASNGLKMM